MVNRVSCRLAAANGVGQDGVEQDKDRHDKDRTVKAQSILWLSVGTALMVLAATGKLNSYLRPSWQSLMMCVGALIFLAALLTEKTTRLPKVGWLVTLPLALAVFVQPQSLGAAMVGHTQQARLTRPPDAKAPNLPPLDPNNVTLAQLTDQLRYGKGLPGTRVTTIGFLAADDRAPSGWSLVRYRIYCCAADAVAYTMLLDKAPAGAIEDEWIQATGTILNGSELAMHLEEVKTVDAPHTPYL